MLEQAGQEDHRARQLGPTCHCAAQHAIWSRHWETSSQPEDTGKHLRCSLLLLPGWGWGVRGILRDQVSFFATTCSSKPLKDMNFSYNQIIAYFHHHTDKCRACPLLSGLARLPLLLIYYQSSLSIATYSIFVRIK